MLHHQTRALKQTMDTITKLFLILLVLYGTALAGYKGYLFLNRKVNDSITLAALAFYTSVLIGFMFLLFFGSLCLLVGFYIFLATPASQ
jgi:hypothetical protein